MPPPGAIATGHPVTSAAAAEILCEGGNAFDAIIAAHFTACVVEPVLASLGGGGYLMAAPESAQARVYDFFAQTPISSQQHELDFFPVSVDFGTTRQEFHIGLGSIATPGSVKGMFAIHRDLGTLPMQRLMEPAVRAAREGVRISAMQAYIIDVVSPIYLHTAVTRALFGSQAVPGKTLQPGETLYQPAQADTLEALGREGADLFYQGEIAREIVQQCRDGGLLTADDLAGYEVAIRPPLTRQYRGATLLLNPPPSSGGTLIAVALALLDQSLLQQPQSVQPSPQQSAARVTHAQLAVAMAATNRARVALGTGGSREMNALLNDELLQTHRREISEHPLVTRGTTQMSVVDGAGNLASMTVSNGEGCGQLVPGTGVMLNNMLGEEDINPDGFFHWPGNTRMTSMMAPTIAYLNGGQAVLGSGGSNRLRSAILQVILNLVEHCMTIHDAVSAPRMHAETGQLHLEPGAWPDAPADMRPEFDQVRHWQAQNLYFGGVHTVWRGPNVLQAAGDPRRGGAAIVL